MSYTIGVVVFVVALLTSVMLHEFGHFLTAKAFGMKASRFFVGFGPTLWSFQRGETEYGVKAIPAGGFVKIEGMTALEELTPGDEDRAFYKQPAAQRVVVLVAGSAVHFVIAILLLFGIIATTGDVDPDHARPTLKVDTVGSCVQLDPTKPACLPTDPKAPAAGKLASGDTVLAIDGTAVSDYTQLHDALMARPGKATTLTLLRAGQRRTVTVTPVPVVVDGKTVGRIGYSPTIEAPPVSVLGAVPKTFTTLGTFTTSTVKAIGGLPREVADILRGKPRNPDGAASVVDVARVSGQIAQAHVSLGARISSLLLIIAELNFFVGIFNLLPLLPLDGGHVGILAFEQARSALYRLLHRRDPGRVDIMKVLPVTYAVVAVFVGLSAILLYAGIADPIRLQ